jgi:hypothetical protein
MMPRERPWRIRQAVHERDAATELAGKRAGRVEPRHDIGECGFYLSEG